MSSTSGSATFGHDAYRTDQLRRLKRIGRIARVMDTAIRIPIVGVRFGADSLMGLLPGVGDAAGGLIGLVMLNEARKLGLPRHKMLKMLGNIAIDTAVGTVPLVGDVFDIYFKAHRRNADLIFDHFGENRLQADGRPMKDITPRRERPVL